MPRSHFPLRPLQPSSYWYPDLVPLAHALLARLPPPARRVSPDPQYDNKLYWYVPPVSDNTDISTRWRLPQGVTCEFGCIMQW